MEENERVPTIDITTEVDGQEIDLAYPGQTVRLRAEISNLEVTDNHRFAWQLPGKGTILGGGDLLREDDPQVIERFWYVGQVDPGTFEITLEVQDSEGTPVTSRGRTVFTIAPAPSERTRGVFRNMSAALQGGQNPAESLRDVIGEARLLGSEFVQAINDSAQASANVIRTVNEFRNMRGDQPVRRIDGSISLQRSASTPTNDAALWLAIKRGADAISFKSYNVAIDSLLCGPIDDDRLEGTAHVLSQHRYLPFNDTDAYRLLKVATEAFLLTHVGSNLSSMPDFTDEERDLASRRLGTTVTFQDLDDYLVQSPVGDGKGTLPYLALVLQNMGDTRHRSSLYENIQRTFSALASAFSRNDIDDFRDELCASVMNSKIAAPLFLELIWSYWQEEGMLVQSMNAISRRFQNVRSPGTRDPLAALEMNPLRPLNNVLWGYVQDEQHRLSVARRAYEYDHHYGITLHGKAVSQFRPADSRSRFIEAFHALLAITADFYRQDDDTTVIADGFQVLNAITEVHFILSQGAHNQFGDLPSTARQEMMMQQWLLSRPEFQEFLPSRAMVAYPEPWMHRVEAMKTLQGWTDASALHFNRLAVSGEQILLSIRYGAWSDVNDPAQAVTWARFWRPEVQGYIHAYRAVTGVELAHDTGDARLTRERMLQPAVHLRRRLEQQQRPLLGTGVSGQISPLTAKPPTRR